MRIGRWFISGFIAFNWSWDTGSAFSVFHWPSPPFFTTKDVVWDCWVPGLIWRIELRKDDRSDHS